MTGNRVQTSTGACRDRVRSQGYGQAACRDPDVGTRPYRPATAQTH